LARIPIRLLALPRPVLRALKSARSAGLRLAGPIDAMKRLAGGRGNLPPLWLRRHTGPVANFERSAREMAAWIESLGVVAPDDLVLDAGCGAGAMVPTFARLLGPGGRYVGFDRHDASLAWCRRTFRADPRLRFETARRGYALRLPAADGEAGFVLAKSLFTHLPEWEARQFLIEIRRVLRPGAAALVTVFLFEPGEGEARASAFVPFASSDGSARWRWKALPESAIAFERARFLSWIAAAGLQCDWPSRGFWPGAAVPVGQDVLLLSHGERRPVSAAAPNTP
jgi:SAM-dependent methyltransferase